MALRPRLLPLLRLLLLLHQLALLLQLIDLRHHRQQRAPQRLASRH